MKIYTTGLGHTTKLAAMPIYGKNEKTFLFPEPEVYNLENWYVALCTRVLPRLFKL